MTPEELLAWVEETYGTEPDYPWLDENIVLRHSSNKKWYGLIMNVGRDKLGLPGFGTVPALNIKLEPLLIGSLRTREGFHPAYHMNKEQWITLRLDGTVPAEDVKALLDMSYRLTASKPKRPRRPKSE